MMTKYSMRQNETDLEFPFTELKKLKLLQLGVFCIMKDKHKS